MRRGRIRERMGKRETKDLKIEIEKSRVELNDLQKRIKAIAEKGHRREELARKVQEDVKQVSTKKK